MQSASHLVVYKTSEVRCSNLAMYTTSFILDVPTGLQLEYDDLHTQAHNLVRGRSPHTPDRWLQGVCFINRGVDELTPQTLDLPSRPAPRHPTGSSSRCCALWYLHAALVHICRQRLSSHPLSTLIHVERMAQRRLAITL